MAAFYFSDSDDEDICPLCCEELDLADSSFLPCPCGYRICMFCWNHIKQNTNGLCPACRGPYSDDPHAFSAVDRIDIVKIDKKKPRQKGDKAGRSSRQVVNKRDLHNMRVVQRNLVYVIGVPPALASEEQLRRAEYFGQYGKIFKIIINHNHGVPAGDPRHGTVSAYVTFAHKEDAKTCIQVTDGFMLDRQQLRSNYGTTKFCNSFLRNLPCANPECLYLHDVGPDDDRFTKEEIQQKSLLVPPLRPGVPTQSGNGGPSGTGKRPTNPILPVPVWEVTDPREAQKLARQKRAERDAARAPAVAAAAQRQQEVLRQESAQRQAQQQLQEQRVAQMEPPGPPPSAPAAAPGAAGGADGGGPGGSPSCGSGGGSRGAAATAAQARYPGSARPQGAPGGPRS